MRSARAVVAVAALLAAAGCSARPGNPARIATGYVSHVVCSYVFVSGLDPARVAAEDIDANPVFRGFHWALRHEVDRSRREVAAHTPFGITSRAVYRDGLGCLNLNGAEPPAVPDQSRAAGSAGRYGVCYSGGGGDPGDDDDRHARGAETGRGARVGQGHA